MTGTVAYALSLKAINDALAGIGVIKGAPCEVDSISKVGSTTTITLKWTDTAGTDHYTSFDVEDGVGVSGATIDEKGDLYLVLTDGTRVNCGKVNSQFTTLPTPSATNVGAILQYVGATTSQYTNGFFYECVLDGGVYKWKQKDVQPNSGSGTGGVTDGYYNSTDGNFYEDSSYTTVITGTNNHIYISVDTNVIYRFDGTSYIGIGGGPGDYNSLANLPQVNGVTLSGNQTADDLNLVDEGDGLTPAQINDLLDLI